MALHDLTASERKTVFKCLEASVEGPFFPDWEFGTLFGMEKDEVRAVIQRWPVDDESDEIALLAINNALNNLLGYPHQEGEAWDQYISAAPSTVRAIFRKWRGDQAENYLSGSR